VTSIGSYAFESCTDLSSIVISNGITHIEQPQVLIFIPSAF